MSKTYYAAKHEYGIEFCNDYVTLFRFATKAERDEFVDNANYDEQAAYGGYQTEEVTAAEARRHFPMAFKERDVHYEADQRDWRKGATETSWYWSADNR